MDHTINLRPECFKLPQSVFDNASEITHSFVQMQRRASHSLADIFAGKGCHNPIVLQMSKSGDLAEDTRFTNAMCGILMKALRSRKIRDTSQTLPDKIVVLPYIKHANDKTSAIILAIGSGDPNQYMPPLMRTTLLETVEAIDCLRQKIFGKGGLLPKHWEACKAQDQSNPQLLHDIYAWNAETPHEMELATIAELILSIRNPNQVSVIKNERMGITLIALKNALDSMHSQEVTRSIASSVN